MPLSLVAVLATVLLLAPALTHGLFETVYGREKAQIAADNAAIVLGREDSRSFGNLASTNAMVRALELQHHQLHLCAKVPQTRAVCRPLDLAMEARIFALHRSAGVKAEWSWRQGWFLVQRTLGELGVRLRRLDRVARVPIIARRCPLCGLSTYWEVSGGRRALESTVHVEAVVPLASRAALDGRSLLWGERWRYRLELAGSAP